MAESIPIDEQDVRDVGLLVRSHYPLLFIAEAESARVLALLTAVVHDQPDLPFFTWKAHRGLTRVGGEGNTIYKTEVAGRCLAHLVSSGGEALTYLYDFESYSSDAENQSRILELHDQLSEHRGALVMSGSPEELPPKLAHYFTVVKLRPPSVAAYRGYVAAVLAEVRRRQPVAVDLTSEDMAELLAQLHGLPFHEIRKIVTQAIVEDGRLDRSDIQLILEAKKRAVERAGVLEYIPIELGAAPVAGLVRLKLWLEKRRIAFTEPARAARMGLPAPRGILLTGVQGCGKSLAAKALSSSFGLPLLRLDAGSLYRKYIGESEQNMRRALATAESVAPCILWIDEIEKAFGGGDNDGGTSRRILGSFLTWLQEKQQSVFVFATSNDISELPPELLRKGRLDEIFFVDLPEAGVREHIFALHIARRELDPANFDLERLGEASSGFSGAEIEQAVLSGLYSAISQHSALTTGILLEELELTEPLSVTMSEKLQALRSWARERAAPAD